MIHKYLISRLSIIVIPVLIFQATTLLGQDPFAYNHPELDWKTFETEHYFIHFHQGTRRTAELVGKIAEDINNTDSVSWRTPAYITDKVKVRVENATDRDSFDTSDDYPFFEWTGLCP